MSLKIFEGGGYKITTRAPSETRSKKVKAETHVVPRKEKPKEADEDPRETEPSHDAGLEATGKKSAPSKVPSAKPAADASGTKCSAHHAPGVERHDCGAWLCKVCLDAEGVCPNCEEPLAKPKAERKKDREADFQRL